MTATSVGITARVFGDLGALKTKEARTIIGEQWLMIFWGY